MLRGMNGVTQIGDYKVFATEGGPHSPQTLAEMTICQCIGEGSNPEKVAIIKEVLAVVHSTVQQGIRRIFHTAGGDDLRRRIIIDALARDIATSLDAERQYHKET